jgi:hypothetical protein
MKNKYTEPTIQVVQIHGGPNVIAASGGMQSTISGYDEDESGGFSQPAQSRYQFTQPK